MDIINIKRLGSAGVNVDKNPLELDDNEVRQAQNAIAAIGSGATIKKRPGLAIFNVDETAGSILGGTTVPLLDRFTGFSVLYLGRGGPV